MWLTKQQPSFGVVASAQLGVPIAAVTVGTQRHLLVAGESAAIILGALITVVAATLASRQLSRWQPAPEPVLSSKA
jgi:hypothetical protein